MARVVQPVYFELVGADEIAADEQFRKDFPKTPRKAVYMAGMKAMRWARANGKEVQPT